MIDSAKSVLPLPEYRRCPATGRWVVFAPERSLRPITLKHASPHHGHEVAKTNCPFCPGSEHLTPNELYAVRAEGSTRDGPDWRLRVVTNKFPAVRDTVPHASIHNVNEGSLLEAMGGYGLHEVVIESPEHIVSPTELSVEQFHDVWVSYRERMHAHARNPDLRYTIVFKNVGAEAGASLAHSHSQLVAMPLVPDAIRAELEEANAYYSREHKCVYCDMIRHERSAGVRVIAESTQGHFIAVCPFAPRFAYEMWILPMAHESRFETSSTEDLLDLAELLKRIYTGLEQVLNEPAYNSYLHTGPLRAAALPYYHWHLEIIPRTDRQAGFEWGSGCFINAVLPEVSTAKMWDSGLFEM